MSNALANANRTTSTALKVATAIAIVGAINWGLIGFFNWNLVDAIFGGGSAETTSTASRVIYAIVGIAGVVALLMLRGAAPDVTRHGLQHPRESH
jgi:uncharacterized membrane protein YuzA (DUF378 family)